MHVVIAQFRSVSLFDDDDPSRRGRWFPVDTPGGLSVWSGRLCAVDLDGGSLRLFAADAAAISLAGGGDAAADARATEGTAEHKRSAAGDKSSAAVLRAAGKLDNAALGAPVSCGEHARPLDVALGECLAYFTDLHSNDVHRVPIVG